jgi:D-glycero-D-manno-heptose 1,7-bisphosphate phosphatase
MGRFSVEKNMISNLPEAQKPAGGQVNVYAPLTMPSVFDKYTIALDRDGVVCECADAITGPDSFIPILDAFRAVAIIRSKGHKIVFLYDQPGISHKKVTVEQVEDCNRHMLNLLGQAGCTSIDGIWYSTSSRKDDIYAKPNLGLFKHAENNSPGVKLSGGVYVGDTLDDLLMADKAGATPVLVLTGKGQKTKEKLKNPIYRMLLPKVKIYDNLMRFAETL